MLVSGGQERLALGAVTTLNLAHNALVYLPAMAFQGLAPLAAAVADNALIACWPPRLWRACLPCAPPSLHHNELQALPGPLVPGPRPGLASSWATNPFTYMGRGG